MSAVEIENRVVAQVLFSAAAVPTIVAGSGVRSITSLGVGSFEVECPGASPEDACAVRLNQSGTGAFTAKAFVFGPGLVRIELYDVGGVLTDGGLVYLEVLTFPGAPLEPPWEWDGALWSVDSRLGVSSGAGFVTGWEDQVASALLLNPGPASQYVFSAVQPAIVGGISPFRFLTSQTLDDAWSMQASELELSQCFRLLIDWPAINPAVPNYYTWGQNIYFRGLAMARNGGGDCFIRATDGFGNVVASALVGNGLAAQWHTVCFRWSQVGGFVNPVIDGLDFGAFPWAPAPTPNGTTYQVRSTWGAHSGFARLITEQEIAQWIAYASFVP